MSNRFFFKILLLPMMLWLLSTASFGLGTRRYVNTSEDLRSHFTSHIKRVTRLGIALYEAHPELFPGITRQEVSEFLGVHDQAKINDAPEFRQKYWVEPGGLSFIDRLFFLYGKGYGFLSDPANAEWSRAIASLNGTDKKVSLDFFRSKGMLDSRGEPTERARILLRIERLADVVDRNTDPVAMEEFNIRQQRPLADFVKDPADLKLAQDLKERYAPIVRGFEYVNSVHSAIYPCGEMALRWAAAAP